MKRVELKIYLLNFEKGFLSYLASGIKILLEEFCIYSGE